MSGPVLIMAGGTGGHVFPALAVADELRARATDVVWLGTRRGLEARLVPAAGIPIDWISVSGVRGKGIVTRFVASLRLLRAVVQALRIVRQRRPSVVLGMGGFASGPGGIAAWLLRRPLVIHEQNSVAGLTNRALARFARRVLQAFPNSFPGGVDALEVGNPIRSDIADTPPPTARAAGERGRLLILGGSQGALALNRLVPGALAKLAPEQRPEVWHQAGARTIDEAREAYAASGIAARVDEFIDDMAGAYRWADLVLCRAGALTVSELAGVGVASILVPFPHAVDDHQTRNAAWLKDAGAAFVVAESDLTETRLADLIGEALANPPALTEMARRARALARPDATRRVADICLAVAKGEAA